MEKPTPAELSKWEKLLANNNLGMDVGVGHSRRLVYGDFYREHDGKKFDYINNRKDRRGLTWLGRKHTAESKQKNRLAHLGKKQTVESRRKKSESLLAYYASRSTTPPDKRARARAYMAKYRAKRRLERDTNQS